jgi:hypothetical protein
MINTAVGRNVCAGTSPHGERREIQNRELMLRERMCLSIMAVARNPILHVRESSKGTSEASP